jgi:hypothetical protein
MDYSIQVFRPEISYEFLSSPIRAEFPAHLTLLDLITLIISDDGCTIGILEFNSRRGLGIFLFTTASRTDLGPPSLRVRGALSLGVKRLGCEADHSPPFSAEVKACVELYLHSPNTPSWRGAQLKKAQRQLYLYL